MESPAIYASSTGRRFHERCACTQDEVLWFRDELCLRTCARSSGSAIESVPDLDVPEF